MEQLGVKSLARLKLGQNHTHIEVKSQGE